LHPRYKTAYLKKQCWPQSWIDTAIALLREEWQRYKPVPTSTPVSGAPAKKGLFAALEEDFSSGGLDALEEYLISPPISSVDDPIRHWKSLETDRYPLACMALDILSVPGM
ncbi:hypothetical protein L226DRAFT_431647, partial [Lentinus tigrinus ALCF2SS1-7]|uniref:uncharacterized protein n=1 Tax=Lentinus tigrinus ALCF2SS1-7 TaxID=1328758 RepID=UPI001165E12E